MLIGSVAWAILFVCPDRKCPQCPHRSDIWVILLHARLTIVTTSSHHYQARNDFVLLRLLYLTLRNSILYSSPTIILIISVIFMQISTDTNRGRIRSTNWQFSQMVHSIRHEEMVQQAWNNKPGRNAMVARILHSRTPGILRRCNSSNGIRPDSPFKKIALVGPSSI